MSETFATVINCTEGNIQLPVLNYIIKHFGVDYVDNITEQGAVCFLDNEEKENAKRVVLHSIKKKVESSITANESKVIAVVAHNNCKHVEGGKIAQLKMLKTAEKTIGAWKHEAEIVLIWVNENGEIDEV